MTCLGLKICSQKQVCMRVEQLLFFWKGWLYFNGPDTSSLNKAERTGDWLLHLSATTDMAPHFFSMDHPNYSRMLPVYLSDMNLLSETHPAVHDEFIGGNHTISQSTQPFSIVWTDMALEQSKNLDSKTKGRIIGISQKPGVLEH